MPQPKPYYEDKWTKIYLGDCREILPQLDVKVDLVLTDPPYSTPVVTSFGRQRAKNYGDLSIQKYYLESLEKELSVTVKESGAVLFHCDDAYAGILFATFYHWHSCQYLIWDKNKIGMGRPFRRQHELMVFATPTDNFTFDNGKTISTILRYPTVPSNEREHGAQKPEDLTSALIGALSAENQMVMDLFLGSGTTCYCAKKLNRSSIGIEIEEKYCEIAANRCRQSVMEFDI